MQRMGKSVFLLDLCLFVACFSTVMADSVPVLMWSNDRWCASVNFDTVIRACRGIQYGVEGSSLKSGPAEGVIRTFCEPHFAVNSK